MEKPTESEAGGDSDKGPRRLNHGLRAAELIYTEAASLGEDSGEPLLLRLPSCVNSPQAEAAGCPLLPSPKLPASRRTVEPHADFPKLTSWVVGVSATL